MYVNDGAGGLIERWGSTEDENTERIIWADFDGDGWLDLAVGNGLDPLATGNVGQPNRIYRNDNGRMRPHWQSDELDLTADIAVADFDGVNGPDLAVANRSQPDRLYRNDGAGNLSLYWSSDDSLLTLSVGFGDADGDGDRDVAFGTGRHGIRVFRNDAGNVVFDWSSAEREVVYSIEFAQFDTTTTAEEFLSGNAARPVRLY